MQPSTLPLGRLERVDPRQVWVTEASHFTPWLAREDNLRLLGQTIGVDLELEAQEKSVGPFRADILCKDTTTGQWVLIENQLERTDHTHLGQLITYAAGLKAVTIVWIASPFTEEHRAALDWLNEITDSRFNFFGLEVELWRIADSPLAPKFNMVCKPNDWSKTVAEGASRVEAEALTDSKQLQLRFWAAFYDFAQVHAERIRPTKPQPQHWMNIAVGRTGFKLAAIASLYDSETESFGGHELRVELVIDGKQSKEHFALLEADRAQIEQEVGEPLTWHNPTKARMCRIYARESVDLQDEANWPRQHAWLVSHLDRLHGVFHRRVRELSVPMTTKG